MQDHASYGDWDLRRFNQLIDLAFSYDTENASSRISDFVTYIQNTKVENPDTVGIRVMTVHAAKGLEFDAVFVPELTEPYKVRRHKYTPNGRIPRILSASKYPLKRASALIGERSKHSIKII